MRAQSRTIVVVFVLAASAFWALPALAEPPLPRRFFGMNVNRVFYDQPSLAVLNAARAAGASQGRFDLTWSIVEPHAPVAGVHTYDWKRMDLTVALLALAHIQPEPILAYGAPWASQDSGEKSPPTAVDDYVAYAKAAVRRYGPGGDFWKDVHVPYLPVRRWEIWNEQNLPWVFWKTGRDADRYAHLYLAARAGIHLIDPGARAVVGGLWRAEVAYLDEMAQAHPELRQQVDGVAIHPYGRTVNEVLARIRRFRAGLDSILGRRVPMEVTEVGWYRRGDGWLQVDDLTRAANLSLITDALARSDCNIDSYEPYTWLTAESTTADPEQWYGIYSPTAGLLESGRAWAASVGHYTSAAARRDARSRRQLLHVCGSPARGAPRLPLRVVPRHVVNNAGTRLYRLTVLYKGRPMEGATVTVQPPLSPHSRHPADTHGNLRIAFIPGTRVWASIGAIAKSPVVKLR